MITNELRKFLWNRFGSLEYPAEWDGNEYGGGKLSQRYWEYHKVIELLSLKADSVVLDIGGGSPKTGKCFLADLLSECVQTIVIDSSRVNSKAEHIPCKADYQTLKKLFSSRVITHVVSVSAIEHMQQGEQVEVVRGIDEFFRGESVVFSFEYHPRKRFFERQLTAKSMHQLFRNFKNFYPEHIEASPMRCENAFRYGIPAWYPLIVKFNLIMSRG